MQTLNRSDLILRNTPFVVAIVEDDVLLRQEIVAHLRAMKFETHDVSSAAALDDLVTVQPIDIYIIDLNLPGESGICLCNRLRQRSPNVGIAKVVRSTTKVVAKKRKAAPRKKRGVTLGQVIALPVVAIASVLFGSRKRRRKSILDNDPRWVEPGSTWRDPSERFKF